MLLVGSYVKLTKKPYESFPVDTTMLGKVIQIENDNILVRYLDSNWIKIYDPNNYVNVVLLSDGGCQCSYMGKDTMVYKAKSANLSIIF